MDVVHQQLNHSSSMADIHTSHVSVLELESQRWNRALKNSQRAFHHTMNSPAYQELRSSTPSIWHTDYQGLEGLLEGNSCAEGSGSGVPSPTSDTTVKLGNGYENRNGSYTKSSVPNAGVTTSEMHVAEQFNASGSVSPSPLYPHSLAGTLAESPRQPHFGERTQTQAKPAMCSLSPFWTPPAQTQNEHAQNRTRLVLNPTYAILDNASSRLSALSSPLDSPSDVHVRRRSNLNQGISSGRMSNLPSIPSPLGPGRMGAQIHERDDGGSLLLSVPDRLLRQDQQLQHRRRQQDFKQLMEGKQRNQGPLSPTIQRYASTSSINSPAFDVYPRSAQIDDEGKLTLRESSFTPSCGHSRKQTDPFIDRESSQYSSTYSKTSLSGPSTPFQLPSHSSIRRPPATPFTSAWPTSAPATFAITTPPTLARPPPLSKPASLAPLPTRRNLPIPPPPLSSIHGQYQHTPDVRRRLDTQKLLRETWIRSEATKIAQLASLKHAAHQRYLATRSTPDYEIWREIDAEYRGATDLETRLEERRNLFIREKGMLALKTDRVEDMSAACRGNVGGGGGKEKEKEKEKLLGFRMAVMERECAEVKRCGDEEEAITVEMLETLSLEEKKALRKHLVARLGRE